MKFLKSLMKSLFKIKNKDSEPPFLPDPFFGYVQLEGRKNCQLNYRMDIDGIIVMRARLSVNDKYLREEIIAKHFLVHLSRFGAISKNYSIVGRDCPWDFRIDEINESFFLEITSISDSEDQFKWLNQQDKIGGLFRKDKPTELDFNKAKKQTNSIFYEKVKKQIMDGQKQSHLIIKNQSYQKKNFRELVLHAVDKKAKKPHQNKSSTLLVIDNRLSYITPADLIELADDIGVEIMKYEFPEVWLYTGCFSDDDGENALFAFYPLKLVTNKSL